MSRKLTLLVTGSGGGGSNNLIDSPRRMKAPVYIVGTNATPFWLARSTADKNYLIPWADAGESYITTLNKIVCDERVAWKSPAVDSLRVATGVRRPGNQ